MKNERILFPSNSETHISRRYLNKYIYINSHPQITVASVIFPGKKPVIMDGRNISTMPYFKKLI